MNDTAQIMQPTAAHEVRRLVQVVNDLEAKFREQRAILAKQGMSLPPGTLSGIQQLRTDLESMLVSFDENFTELQQLRELSRTTELINSTLDLDDVLNGVMDTVISLTKAERGYLMLRDAVTNIMEFRIARNIEQRTLESQEFIVSNTVVQEVANSGQPVVTMNAADDPRFAEQKSVVGYALRSILCVPLMLHGKVTGVVYADNRIRQGVFGNKELNLLQAFANQAAVAIENARLFESLRSSLAEITAYKELMDNVFASIASGVITTDQADRITQLNEAATRILNLKIDFIGKEMWDAMPAFTASLAERCAAVRLSIREELIELTHELEGRGVANLNFRISPLRTATQTIEGLAIVVDDLTELKQRQEQLRVVRRYLTPAMVDNIESIDKLGLAGERRECSVLYVDVRGFQTFPKGLDPQDLMALLNTYLTVAAEAITQYNGVIDKFMANEVMGLYNTQLNHDTNHAWNAVASALAMVDEYRELYQLMRESEGVSFFRVGIHTGLATLGNVGTETRKEFTAIGDTINIGHRMLENAHAGEIVISEETARQCLAQISDPANRVQIAALEEIPVKGRVGTIKIYRLRRA